MNHAEAPFSAAVRAASAANEQACATLQDFEDLLDFARAIRGLVPTSIVSKPEQAEITLWVPDETGGSWVAYLTGEGFRFDAACSYRSPCGNTAIESVRPANALINRPAHRATLILARRPL